MEWLQKGTHESICRFTDMRRNAESRSRRTGAGDFQSERYNSRLEFDIGNQRDSPAIPTADFRGK